MPDVQRQRMFLMAPLYCKWVRIMTINKDYSIKRFEAEIDIETYVKDYVDVETFMECCKACPNYNKVWSCPPYDFNPLDYWNSFDRLLVVGYQLNFGSERTAESMTGALWDIKQKLTEELYSLEEEFPGSESLSAGTCRICDGCSKSEGTPCRFPEKMRYSIESIGGNVGKTISDLCGIELEWIEEGKLPEHYALVGGLLKNNLKE